MKKARRSMEESMSIIRGNEPCTSEKTYKIDLIRALNWYNVSWEEKQYRLAAQGYIKQHNRKDLSSALNRASFNEIRVLGALSRLIQRNQYVAAADVERMWSRMESLKLKYSKEPKQNAGPEAKTKPSIQERMENIACEIMAEIDGEIDLAARGESTFSMKNMLLAQQVSGPVAKKIAEFYKPLLVELQEAQQKKCPQLKEAYSFMSAIQLRRFTEFVSSIIDACIQQTVTSKVQRKPRVKKVKPPSVIARNVKYMKEFVELKMKSIDPAKIIGASELWVYIPNRRKMVVYKSADSSGLGVTGTSIINYDVKTTECKTIRKPDEFFKNLSSTSKRTMANAWKALTTKPASPRSRLNDEMILFCVN